MKENYLHSKFDCQDQWQRKNDAEVWSAFLKGDKQAFEYIYQTYVDELFSYGMSVRTNKSLVKDSIQDLFVELWNRRDFLSVTTNIKFYLYRALRRRITHFIERDKQLYDEQPVDSHINDEIVLPFEQKIISQQIDEERKNKIRNALFNISARQREIINLIFFEHLSYEEVSEIMSINIKSVYTLTWKAISSLKKGLPLLVLSFCSL